MIGVSVVSGSRRVVGRVLADGQWEGGICFFFVRYSSSRLSIRIGVLLVGGWLAGVSFCLCSCRSEVWGLQWGMLPPE